jgi:hypothetical protein
VNEAETPRTPIRTRLLAILILGICGWILLKIVLHVIAGVATIIVVGLAIFGVIWAFSKL